jgi:uncharacterized Zn-finger protein
MAFADVNPTPDVATVERVIADSRVVACDGSEGALGHPRVWLRIVDRQIFCPYCSRLFVLRDGAGAGDDHGH